MSSIHVDWHVKAFKDLTVFELHDLLKYRSDVFVVEQDCVYSDIDGLDTLPSTRHVFAYVDDQLVGTCRLLSQGVVYDDFSAIGRVVINPQFRGNKLAYPMMQTAISHIEAMCPGVDCKISAQEHLAAFYQSLGFVTVSDMYLEDGIPHVSMVRRTMTSHAD